MGQLRFVSESNARAILRPIFPEKRCALELGEYGNILRSSGVKRFTLVFHHFFFYLAVPEG